MNPRSTTWPPRWNGMRFVKDRNTADKVIYDERYFSNPARIAFMRSIDLRAYLKALVGKKPSEATMKGTASASQDTQRG